MNTPASTPATGTDPEGLLVSGRRSDLGRQRELNEDSLVSLEWQAVRQSRARAMALYAVADGMGGHAAGEVASATAIEALAGAILKNVLAQDAGPLPGPATNGEPAAGPQGDRPEGRRDYGALLKETCRIANRAVYAEARQRHSDMGTTLVVALVVGQEAWVANIGDSRAYHLDGQGLRQVTTDHSLVMRLVAAGQITKEEARTHPQRNMIYRTVGEHAEVEVDIFHLELAQGDGLLLCSDGLHGLVEEAEIRRVLLDAADPQAACEMLVDMANAAGGHDNISAIVVRMR